LCASGYRLVKVRAVDLFSHTAHVETVVLLSREKIDGYVEIDLDVEKLEGKATYE
jgi:23S rRNA (uracil1939-C5)-methyltransferase